MGRRCLVVRYLRSSGWRVIYATVDGLLSSKVMGYLLMLSGGMFEKS